MAFVPLASPFGALQRSVRRVAGQCVRVARAPRNETRENIRTWRTVPPMKRGRRLNAVRRLQSPIPHPYHPCNPWFSPLHSAFQKAPIQTPMSPKLDSYATSSNRLIDAILILFVIVVIAFTLITAPKSHSSDQKTAGSSASSLTENKKADDTEVVPPGRRSARPTISAFEIPIRVIRGSPPSIRLWRAAPPPSVPSV